MTRRPLGGRTLASLPMFCVCGGDRRLRLVSVFGRAAVGVMPCPHCNVPDDYPPIEIRTYRMRDDKPRGAA